jgi:hypothetical protein
MLAPDPLHVCIALGPLAMYFVVLGIINLSSRPLLTTGGRDFAALAIGLSGLVVAGPMELFLAEGAAVAYGGWVWAMMLVAYALCVALLALMMRPRLVVYNMALEQLRPLVADVATRLDCDARWAGDTLVMPLLGVELHVEASPAMKNVQLVASGSPQNLFGWRRLERELVSALRPALTMPNPAGYGWILLGLMFGGGISWYLAGNPASVTQALNEMFSR